MIELLVATGWDLGSALLAAMPEASSLRRAPHPHAATLRRGTAGLLAPWDGPAAIVFSDGRRVGAILDRNGLRPAAFAVTSDRLVAVASEAGAIPLGRVRHGPPRAAGPGRDAPRRPAARRDPRGRRREGPPAPPPADPRRAASGPRRPGTVGRDATVRNAVVAPLPRRARRREGPPRHQDDGRRGPRAALVDGRRHADPGPRPRRPPGRRPPPPGVRPGHEPADRPGAREGRHGPAGRPRPAAGAARWPAARQPPLADDPPEPPGRSPTATRSSTRSRAGSAGWTRPGRPAKDQTASRRPSIDSPRPRSPPPAAGAELRRPVGPLVLAARRLPIPSVLAAGAVNTALTDAGLRGRTDVLVDAADVLDVHSLAMTLAAGATAVVPWLAVELAIETAGSRGAEDLTPRRRRRQPARRRSRRASARRSPGWASARSPRTSAGCLFESIELDDDVRGRCFRGAPAWPGTIGLADLAERALRRADAARAIARRPAVEPPARSRLRPLPGRRRGPPVLAAERRRVRRPRVGRRADDRRRPRALSVGAGRSRVGRPRRAANPPRRGVGRRRPRRRRARPRHRPTVRRVARCRSGRSRRRPTRR